jgi:enamine deaminase RidA (YjgF/YER057c/UK114 family)
MIIFWSLWKKFSIFLEVFMDKVTKINPTTMKQPTKAYSNGIFVPKDANLLFVTGQVAQDSEGKVIAPHDMAEQTRYIFGQIGKILNAADMTFDDVVKTTIFVVDMSKSSCISPIRDEFFINSKPASSMIGVTGLVKPECVVEIEVVAAKL